jgi:XTP/dITP diphosphohydrolase
VAVRGLAELDDPPELSEPYETFAENALAKALTVAQATGEPALADDSGLVVDALDGAPGVMSARYAGEDATAEQLVAKLLRELVGVPEEDRTARFVCVLSLASPEGELGQWTGVVEGRITSEPVGEGGFGYDPVFWERAASDTTQCSTIPRRASLSPR